MAMQPTQTTDAEDTQDGGADENTEGSEGSTFLELEIKQDGTFMVSLESGQEEDDEESGTGETGTQEQAEPAGTPAKDLKSALKIIESIAKQVMGAAPTSQAQTQEDAGYRAGMAGG